MGLLYHSLECKHAPTGGFDGESCGILLLDPQYCIVLPNGNVQLRLRLA